MVTITSIELIAGIASLPFYLAAIYLFFTRARTRHEKRGMFFTLGLMLIVFSYLAEFSFHLFSIHSFEVLSIAVFGLAGISMIFSCYLASKHHDKSSTGGN